MKAAANYTYEQLLNDLAADGQFDLENQAQVEEILSVQEPVKNPWYIRLFVGISAWISAILVIAALAFSTGFDEAGALFIGALFIIGSYFLLRAQEDSDFVHQLVLAFSIAGQFLLLFGISNNLPFDEIPFFLVTIGIEVAFIWFFRDWLLRFLATLAIVACLAEVVLIIIDNARISEDNLVYMVLVFPPLALWVWENEARFVASEVRAEIFYPVAYALMIVALGSTAGMVGDWLQRNFPVLMWLLLITLGAMAVYRAYHLLSRYNVPLTSPSALLAFGGILISAVIMFNSPGFLLALSVLALAFQRRLRTMFWLAVAFLIWYIGFYYYHLGLTLLVKSYVLLGSGALLLALRWLLRYWVGKGAEEVS